MDNKYQKLLKVQQELKAPKNQKNTFGGYNYRSCEDILEAVKPLLVQHGLLLSISDEIKEVGGRVYVCATASLFDVESREDVQSVTAYAREEDTKKGMDAAQVTGATSSYARKYALNGLFAIDDTKDVDSTEYQKQKAAEDGKKALGNATSQQKAQKPSEAAKQANTQPSQPAPKPLQLTEEQQMLYDQLNADIDSCDSVSSVLANCLMAEGQPYELQIRKKCAKKGIELATSKEEVRQAYDLIKDRDGWQEIKALAEAIVKTKGLK